MRIAKIFFAAAVCIAFAVLVFREPVLHHFGAIQWDAIGVHFFNLHFSSFTWHQGVLPIWTPYLYSGFPQVADLQVGIFYPVNLVLALFTTFTPQLMMYQIVLHNALAAFFTFLLARHLSKNFFFSIGAGLAYGFGGFMIGHASHVGMQNTAALLPLVVLLLVLTLERGRFIWAFLCGGVLGFSILAGHFQMALYSMFAIGMIWAVDTVIVIVRARTVRGVLLKRVGMIAVVFVLAASIGAVQILPTYELTSRSQRVAISLEASQSESLNPDSLHGLLDANYHDVARGEYTGPWDKTQNYLFLSITVLILALAGIALGLIKKGKRRYVAVSLVLLLIALEYSFGRYGFLQEYFYRLVPMFNKIRAPGNMMLLVNLCIIILASIALASIKKGRAIVGIVLALLIGFELFHATSHNQLLYGLREPETIMEKVPMASRILKEYESLDELHQFSVFKLPGFEENQAQAWGIYAFDGYNPLELTTHVRYVDAMVQDPSLVDFAGIKYLPCEFITKRAGLQSIGRICINDRYFPRAYLQYGTRYRFDQITNLKTTPSKWELDVAVTAPARLIINQADYPGWRASVDGGEIAIEPFEHFFQSIAVPQGSHHIVFTYHSRYLVPGLAISIAGLIVLLCAILWYGLRHPPRSHQTTP